MENDEQKITTFSYTGDAIDWVKDMPEWKRFEEHCEKLRISIDFTPKFIFHQDTPPDKAMWAARELMKRLVLAAEKTLAKGVVLLEQEIKKAKAQGRNPVYPVFKSNQSLSVKMPPAAKPQEEQTDVQTIAQKLTSLGAAVDRMIEPGAEFLSRDGHRYKVTMSGDTGKLELTDWGEIQPVLVAQSITRRNNAPSDDKKKDSLTDNPIDTAPVKDNSQSVSPNILGIKSGWGLMFPYDTDNPFAMGTGFGTGLPASKTPVEYKDENRIASLKKFVKDKFDSQGRAKNVEDLAAFLRLTNGGEDVDLTHGLRIVSLRDFFDIDTSLTEAKKQRGGYTTRGSHGEDKFRDQIYIIENGVIVATGAESTRASAAPGSTNGKPNNSNAGNDLLPGEYIIGKGDHSQNMNNYLRVYQTPETYSRDDRRVSSTKTGQIGICMHWAVGEGGVWSGSHGCQVGSTFNQWATGYIRRNGFAAWKQLQGKYYLADVNKIGGYKSLKAKGY
jgi:hypothetical protein